MKIEEIVNHTIIICEDSYKKNILTSLAEKHLFLNVKFLRKDEFWQEYFFKTNEKALYYLISHYKMKPALAEMYLDNLKYIDKEEYNDEKLDFLVKLKKELEQNNLLIYNPHFLSYLQSFEKIFVIGYDYLESYEEEIFKKINATIIRENRNNKIKTVYEFKTMNEEITFVVKKISALIDENIDINHIKLVNVSKEYYNNLQRIFKIYNIPLKIPLKNSLYSYQLTQTFINNLDLGIDYAIKKIKHGNHNLVNKIITVCNKYLFTSFDEYIKELIIADLKKITIDNYDEENYVEIKDINDLFLEDDYVFVMNFNSPFIPKIVKDDDYIDGANRLKVNLKEVVNINKEIKENTKRKLQNLPHVIITYKLRDNKTSYYPSSLVEELNLQIEYPKEDILTSYSHLADELTLASLEYNYEIYGTVTDEYLIYKNNLNIPYKKFDNKYKNIDKESLRNYLAHKLSLSYTSLHNFNRCAFRYYIENILNLNKYEETFEAFIGSIFHDVLEKVSIDNATSIEEEVQNYVLKSGKILNAKEKFFLKKMVSDLKFVLNVINEQKKYISLNNELHEKRFVIDKLVQDVQVSFKGFIDKILYEEEKDETVVAIIDYKTGNVSSDLRYLPNNFVLQLPIYLYLVKSANIFVNPKFAGFYLQFILNKNLNKNDKMTFGEAWASNLKLVGFSNKNIELLKKMDSSYENSQLISGLKCKKDGDFVKTAQVLSDDEIEQVISLTEKIIDTSINDIIEAKFSINPKKIGYDKDLGCEFCKFRDICFKTEKDYVILEEVKDLSFLGGDESAKMD